jgi:MFS transporter, NHS family, xanthosine permease
MMMTNGLGSFLGSILSGWIIDSYYTMPDKNYDWHGIWLAFAAYALVVAILFAFLFKHKHNPAEISLSKVNH